MHAVAFGCMLEKAFEHRDPHFNCATRGFQPVTDPCRHGYYDGPAFPDGAVTHVDPHLQALQLSWEHGELQSVRLDFAGKLTAKVLAQRFALGPLEPSDDPQDPEIASASYPQGHPNISSVSIQRCGKDTTCLVLQGFDHTGSGDVDCP